MGKGSRLQACGRVSMIVAAAIAMTFGVGCGSSVDGAGKDGKPIELSPNDPNGTQPPNRDEPADPNEDQNLEQPGDGECTPPDTEMPAGWVTHAMKNFSLTTPAAMTVGYSYEDVMGRSVIDLEGEPGITLGMEAKDRTSLDSTIGSWKAVLGGKSGTYCTAQMVVTKTTFRCEPAVRIHAECPTQPGSPPHVIDVLGVLHDGHMFEAACERNGVDPEDGCVHVIETLRMK